MHRPFLCFLLLPVVFYGFFTFPGTGDRGTVVVTAFGVPPPASLPTTTKCIVAAATVRNLDNRSRAYQRHRHNSVSRFSFTSTTTTSSSSIPSFSPLVHENHDTPSPSSALRGTQVVVVPLPLNTQRRTRMRTQIIRSKERIRHFFLQQQTNLKRHVRNNKPRLLLSKTPLTLLFFGCCIFGFSKSAMAATATAVASATSRFTAPSSTAAAAAVATAVSSSTSSSASLPGIGILWTLVTAAVARHVCVQHSLSLSTVVAGFTALGSHALLITSTLLAWYMHQLTCQPILTKSLTAGIIAAIGDIIAQQYSWYMMTNTNVQVVNHQLQNHDHSHEVKHDEPFGGISSQSQNQNRSRFFVYDQRRGISCFLYGLLISGPLMHCAYDLFETILPTTTMTSRSSSSSSSTFAALTHVLADSIFLDSVFVATTFCVTGLIEGYRWNSLKAQLRNDYVPTLKASWMASLGLLPIEFVCFRYLPVSLRVLSVNMIDVVWDSVVSFMTHRSRHHVHHLDGAGADVVVREEPVIASSSNSTCEHQKPTPQLHHPLQQHQYTQNLAAPLPLSSASSSASPKVPIPLLQSLASSSSSRITTVFVDDIPLLNNNPLLLQEPRNQPQITMMEMECPELACV